MRLVNCEQGSAEWLQLRAGKITASRIGDVMYTLKAGGPSADKIKYSLELIAERLTQRAEEHYVSKDMENGTEWEPFARTAYELERDVMCDMVGFVLHPTLDFYGASPDGLVGTDGMIEIKCPRTTTHLKWLMAGVVPEEHEPQMSAGMACCERQWCDFVSYCPWMPDGLKTFIVRMERDEARILEIEQEVIRFNISIDSVIEQLMQRVMPPKAEIVEAIGTDAEYLDTLMDVVGDEIIP